VTDDPRSEARWLERSESARTTTALLFGVLLACTRTLTLPGTALVLAGGVAVWMIDPELTSHGDATFLGGEPEGSMGPTRAAVVAGVVTWSLMFASFVLWEAAAFFLGNDDAHPTFSTITDPFFAFRPTRALVGFAWLVWGWHLRSR
jgi:hypothetical protein